MGGVAGDEHPLAAEGFRHQELRAPRAGLDDLVLELAAQGPVDHRLQSFPRARREGPVQHVVVAPGIRRHQQAAEARPGQPGVPVGLVAWEQAGDLVGAQVDDEQLADQVAGAVVVDVEEVAHPAVGAVAAHQVLGEELLGLAAVDVVGHGGDAGGALLETVQAPAHAQLDVGVLAHLFQQHRLQVHLGDALHGLQRQAAVAAGADGAVGLVHRLVDQVPVGHHPVEGPAGRSGHGRILVGARGVAGGADLLRQAQLAKDLHGAAVHHIQLGMAGGFLAVVEQHRAHAQAAQAQRQGHAHRPGATDEDGYIDHAAISWRFSGVLHSCRPARKPATTAANWSALPPA
ncbi:hypothetical protein FQZ97_868530 [compost metagenome]